MVVTSSSFHLGRWAGDAPMAGGVRKKRQGEEPVVDHYISLAPHERGLRPLPTLRLSLLCTGGQPDGGRQAVVVQCGVEHASSNLRARAVNKLRNFFRDQLWRCLSQSSLKCDSRCRCMLCLTMHHGMKCSMPQIRLFRCSLTMIRALLMLWARKPGQSARHANSQSKPNFCHCR